METTELVFADRSSRVKLRFSGRQAAWFLHQILTQSFEDMKPGEARDAAMITAHGRMTGYLEVVATEDAFLAHFEPSLKGSLPEAIRRYVFATEVEIEDVTGAMGLVLVAGDGALEAARTLPEAVVHPTSPLGVEATYVWIERDDLDDALRLLEKEGATEASEDELELIRVANGIPRWGFEMDEKTFPQEVGIDERAVHYDKGCYLGQEAMAKIHFRGKVNRRLVKLETDAATAPGTPLLLDGTAVGAVTSAAGQRALAVVKQAVRPGSRLDAGGIGVRVVS